MASRLELRPVRSDVSLTALAWGIAGGFVGLLALLFFELRVFRGKTLLGPAGSRRGQIRPIWLTAAEATHGWADRGEWSYRHTPRVEFRGAPSHRHALQALGRRILVVAALLLRCGLALAVTVAVGLATVLLLAVVLTWT